jgi:NTP pyrophosphatase (non-canonical NTP hydrolase)
MSRENVLNEVSIERDAQQEKHGEENQGASLWMLMSYLAEEAGEAAKALNEAFSARKKAFEPILIRNLRTELVQTAAMAVQIIERIDAGIHLPAPATKKVPVEKLLGFEVGDKIKPLVGNYIGRTCTIWSIELDAGARNGWFTCRAPDNTQILLAGEELELVERKATYGA